MKRVVIVSGSLGVGKSAALKSMRQALAKNVSEVAVLESDDFYMMIDPHWTLPASRVEWYYEVSGRLLRETALGFLRAGFVWVAIGSNGHWTEAPAREFARPLVQEGADVHHITLDPGDDVTRTRIRARERARTEGPPLGIDVAMQMLSEVRSCYGPWTHVIDNGALTPIETALAIYEAVTAGSGRL